MRLALPSESRAYPAPPLRPRRTLSTGPFIPSFLPSFNKYLVSARYVWHCPGSEGSAVNKIDVVSGLMELIVWQERQTDT